MSGSAPGAARMNIVDLQGDDSDAPLPASIAFALNGVGVHQSPAPRAEPAEAEAEVACRAQLSAITQMEQDFQTPSQPSLTPISATSLSPAAATSGSPGTLQQIRSLFEGHATASQQESTPVFRNRNTPLGLGNAPLPSAGPVGKPQADVSFSRRSAPSDVGKKKSAKKGKKKGMNSTPVPDVDAAHRFAERILDSASVDHHGKQDFTLMSLVNGHTTIHMAKDFSPIKVESEVIVRGEAGHHTVLGAHSAGLYGPETPLAAPLSPAPRQTPPRWSPNSPADNGAAAASRELLPYAPIPDGRSGVQEGHRSAGGAFPAYSSASPFLHASHLPAASRPAPAHTRGSGGAGADLIPEVEEPWCCAPWAMVVRPVVGVIFLVAVLPLFIVTVLSIAVAMFLSGLCIACGLHASLPPEPPTHHSLPQNNGAPPPRRPRIFFDGSGWGFGFALGAARHMYQQFDFQDQVEVIGVSAGNVAAICLLLGKDPWELVQELYPRFRRRVLCRACSRPLIGFCSRLGMVRELLEELIPEGWHLQVSHRLHVVVGSWPTMRLRYISSFASKQELIDAVLCSMAVPGFVAAPLYSPHSAWSGFYVDGGLKHMMTPLESRSDVTVRTLNNPLKSCFRSSLLTHRSGATWSEDDVIKPLSWLPPGKLLWPPTLRALYDLMEEGRMQAAKSPQLSQPLFAPFLRSARV